MPEIYNGFALRLGDDDRQRKYGGKVRSPSDAGAANHITTLRDDLVQLGFFLARETRPDVVPTFDRWLEEAVREFQVMARQPVVARERAAPPEADKYLLRLEPVKVPLNERYPLPESGAIDQYASGVVNETTRKLISFWKDRHWRCPWVIAEWEVLAAPDKPKKSLKPRSKKTASALDTGYVVERRRLKRYDLTVSGRTSKVNGEVFLHDFSGLYFDNANPAQPDTRLYLGKEKSYGSRRGPVGWPGLPDTQKKLIKVTPELLTGVDIDNQDSALASTFRVVAAVASIEVSHGFQLVNGYDLACLSGGLCHFALVSPNFKEPKLVGKGELGGVMAWLEHHHPDQFNKYIGGFGLWPEIAWGANGASLLNPNSGIWECFSCRESADRARGLRVDERNEADVLQSWQWLARFTMLPFVAAGYARGNWALARMRLRKIHELSIGGNFPAEWTIGSVFSSERLVAKLLRVHVQGSSRLGSRLSANKPPVSKEWVRCLLEEELSPAEIKIGPSKWDDAIMARLEAALDKRFKRYADRIEPKDDPKGKLVKGDFTRLAEWTWKGRPLSISARSFQLSTDDL